MPAHFPLRQVALAAAAAALHAGAAHAQGAAPAAPASAASSAASSAAATTGDGLQLERIVVTGSSQARSKMRSSVSISTIEADSVVTSTAGSAAEILRSVPGLRSESSGGESNANVGVRGIPISAGGARYVQFQEDGLPVAMFGDVAFGTPDTWIRADIGLDRLEVVRGGSASTLATGAPGGIINYISKTGEVAGGNLALSYGLGYDHARVELDYGGPIGNKTRFWIGGFQRTGDGGRPGAEGVESGGQIRGNLTHKFGQGEIRLSFKHLDDQTPTFMPTPVRFVNGKIEEIAGLDPRTTAFYNAPWPLDRTLLANNSYTTSNIRNGQTAKSDAFGALLNLDAGGGIKLSNNFRWARNSGRFIGIFPGTDVAAAPAGTTVAAGAGAGNAYTGDWFQAVVFNTSMDDFSLLANDLKLSKDFNVGGGKLTATGGLFTSRQTLKVTWNFNQYALSADGDGARLLDVPGAANGVPGFGGCCMNFQDSSYSTRALFAGLSYDAGPLTLDGSIRRDRNSAIGSYIQTIGPGGTPGTAYDVLQPQIIDYAFSNTSYSLGGNYQLNKDLAVFGRISEGAAYLADRITFFNNPDLVNGTSGTIPTNEVRQFEVGAKWRSGGLSAFVTLFNAKTNEINVDPTTTPIAVTQNEYNSKGVELELGWRMGAVSVIGGLTLTDAEVTKSSNAALVGKTPKRQARAVWQIAPTWQATPALLLGASIVGTSSSKDDSPAGPLTVELPAFTSVNAVASYALSDNMSLSLAVNNLFDTIGYTESNDGRGAARSINGRTAKATLKYSF
ncbi:MAG: TonB-dependent receptor [Rubrivivax sp.]|nr:TonB-dependent receptor [Rubrivivax sp.]